MMDRYVEIKRTQTVRIPIYGSAHWTDARNLLRNGVLFLDDDILNYDDIEVVDEDYHGYEMEYSVVENGCIKAMKMGDYEKDPRS